MKDERDAEVLRAIWGFWIEHSIPPTRQDIVDATSIKSKSTVHYALLSLEEKGEIELRRGHPVPMWVIGDICGQ